MQAVNTFLSPVIQGVIIDNYLIENPALDASLQALLTQYGIETGVQLTAWGDSMTPDGDGPFSSVAEAIAAYGISLDDIDVILTQLESNGPAGFGKKGWKSDINNDGSVGGADLLEFLGQYGTNTYYDSTQNYLGIQDPNT